jgi:Family of unknown function (DUF5681)
MSFRVNGIKRNIRKKTEEELQICSNIKSLFVLRSEKSVPRWAFSTTEYVMSAASIRTQFKTGQSGNPKGRPKRPKSLEEQRDTLTRIACMLLDQPCHVLGSDRTETRREQWMRDLAARGDLGELRCMNTVFNFADRGDRRRLQALRLALRAKKPRVRVFEEYAADLIAQPPPKLRADQQHVILPAREVRLEHEKPRPRPKRDPGFFNAKGEPELYNKKGEINPWYLEKVEPDPSAHQPKYPSVAELRAREQERIDEMMRRHREMREADAKLRAEAAQKVEVAPDAAPEAAAKTGPKAGPETGVITGDLTGVISGPITGLSGIVRPPQTLAATRKSKLLNGTSDFSHLISPRNDDEAHVNGSHVNGSSMNGKSMNGSHHNGSHG